MFGLSYDLKNLDKAKSEDDKNIHRQRNNNCCRKKSFLFSGNIRLAE
jgi:hypothetical protein